MAITVQVTLIFFFYSDSVHYIIHMKTEGSKLIAAIAVIYNNYVYYT